MKLYVFEMRTDPYIMFATTEGGAKELKKQLDQDGVDYNLSSYASVYDYLHNLQEWDDESVSDGEVLDACMKVLGDLGI